MPNQQQIRRVTEEERIKLGSLQEESRFYAADMSLEKNEMYRNIDRYNNVEKVAQDVAFAEEMLQLPSTAELNLTAEERGSLTMNLNRKQNFLLLNDGKFTGDSTEMQRVKAELGNLETLLGEHGVLNFKELTELDQAYRNAYKACQDYVNNKNPWFPTGKRRLEKVKATMKRLVQEQRCLAAGAEMLQKGLIDKEQIKTPYDLIQSEMTQNLDLQEKKEKYAKKCEQDQAISDQWLPDFFEAMGIDEYMKEAQKVNPLITKEDAKWHMFREFEHYITSYSPVDLIEKDGKKEIVEKPADKLKVFPPIFKEFGLAGALEKKGLMLDATAVGSASREIAPCIYFIKRDKQGNPLNQEEVQKDAFNKKWLADFDAYFEAKGKVVATEKAAAEAEAQNEAAKKAAAEKELITLRADEKAAADKVFNNFVERVEKAANTIVLPDAEEIKKDPSLVEKLVYRNIDEFLFLLTMPGQWSQLQRHVAPEQLIQYRKDHPKIVEFMSNASLFYPAFLEKRMDHVHHYAKDSKRNLLSDRAGELENLKKTGASEDEIRDMQDMVNEEETSFQELQKESLESYADQAVYMKENHASSFLNKDTSFYK